MNSIATIFLIVNCAGMLLLPRQWAVLPLLLGACYVNLSQVILLGPFHFTVVRLLIAVGLIRIMVRKERIINDMNIMDKLMLILGLWILISSSFHADAGAALIYRLGMVYNMFGLYFLLRIFCGSFDDIIITMRILVILLVPLAFEMLIEKGTGLNWFSAIGWSSQELVVRDGIVRAQGPFSHPIIAGTVGSVCVPIMVGLWFRYRKTAILGLSACIAMIFASSSSGPILCLIVGIVGVLTWPYRYNMRLFRWTAIFAFIGLDIVMNAPPEYILARLDVMSGSSGWHRAALIDTAFKHISEWWFTGTDYTRHWMPYGVTWSENHIDITNHYLNLGVTAGLPATILFISVLAAGFSFAGRNIRQDYEKSKDIIWVYWAFGASLFVHVIAMISISYFDQSELFLYLVLACLASTELPRHLSVKFQAEVSSVCNAF